MAVVWVELLALGVNFEIFGSICAPVPGLLVAMVIEVELGKEGLDIAFIVYGYKDRLKLLSEVQLLVAVSIFWCLSASSAAE